MDFQNVVVDVAIRAERRAGELLAEMEKNKGGKGEQRPYRSGDTTSKKLSDLGITKDQSSRWQKWQPFPRRNSIPSRLRPYILNSFRVYKRRPGRSFRFLWPPR